MIIFLYTALGYLLLTTIVLFCNRKDFIPLYPSGDKDYDSSAPTVSICIPARNEEDNIKRCLSSVLAQAYPNMEVLVLDHGSTDDTLPALQQIKSQSRKPLTILQGTRKPAGWLGKHWACQQLANHSGGDIIIFLDADAWLKPHTISRVVKTMGHDLVELLTVWPMQELRTFGEKITIPLVYYCLLSLLPARYVYRLPGWIPSMLRRRLAPLFSAGCGQLMAFKRNAYEAIGGHRAVRDKAAENMALAREIKRGEFRMRMYHGYGTVGCRMYSSERELYEGFRKKFLAGFGYNTPLFLLMGFIHFLVYLLPFIFLVAGILYSQSFLALLSLTAILIMWLHRMILSRWFGWNLRYTFLQPLGVIWFQALGIRVLRDYFAKMPVFWKKRTV